MLGLLCGKLSLRTEGFPLFRVVLEALSPDVEAVVAEHNAVALDYFLGYIHDYIVANAAALPPGNVLPLSKLCYPRDNARQDFDPRAGGALQEFHKEVLISSPFVALSGEQ